VLHDARGIAVGTLHAVVVTEDATQTRLSEQWSFRGAAEDTEVTWYEIVDASLRPSSAFYHEKVRDQSPERRVLRERFLRLQLEGDSLIVEARGEGGRRRIVHGFPDSARLPLAFAESIRRNRNASLTGDVLVFDAATESFVARNVLAPAQRLVPAVNSGKPVREIAWVTGGRRQAMWLDASARTLRREVNGESLVALPMAEARARELADRGASAAPAAVVEDREQGLRLRLPNPTWRADETTTEGVLRASAPLVGATVTLQRVATSVDGAPATEGADIVLRTLERTHRDFTELGRRMVGETLVVTTRHVVHREGEDVAVRSEHRFASGRRKPAWLWLAAPEPEWDSLAVDFERIAAGVETRTEAVGERPLGILAPR
jgi:hypothetical protein